MHTFFQHREVHKYTWYRPSMDQKFLIDFCIVSSDMFSDVLEVRVKLGAELSTDHHLAVCSLRVSKSLRNRKFIWSSMTYRIKWEALEHKEIRKQFASTIIIQVQITSWCIREHREGMAAVQISNRFISC